MSKFCDENLVTNNGEKILPKNFLTNNHDIIVYLPKFSGQCRITLNKMLINKLVKEFS